MLEFNQLTTRDSGYGQEREINILEKSTKTSRDRLDYLKEYRKNNQRSLKSSRLKTLYGVTIEEYEKMYEKQEGKCAICKEHKPLGTKKGLIIDHNHNTGKVRELLCTTCNSLLGRIEANNNIINEFFNYIDKHNNGVTIF